MKTLPLTKLQVDAICKQLDDAVSGIDGKFDIDVELDENITVNVRGQVETDGYYEDDYFNGTGAWVETYRDVTLDVTAKAYDEKTNTETDYMIDPESEKAIYDYLAAA